MTSKLYIDGVDAYTAFGVFPTKGGYKSLMSYPPLKAVESTDWPDEDGAEVDLSAPALDSQELTLHFSAHRMMLVGDFMTLLSDMTYHDFRFTELNKTYRLRLVSMPDKAIAVGVDNFSLRFADDFPLRGYEYASPAPIPEVWQRGYTLDGVDLSQYGVSLLGGSDAEIGKSPQVKKGVFTDIKSRSGIIHDDGPVKFAEKDVTLRCYMYAPTVDVFWRNYNALLFDLIRPGERVFYSDKTKEDYACRYKNSIVDEAIVNGFVACRFNLTLTFTSFRISEDIMVLATEAGEIILTEDGYAIGVKDTMEDIGILATENNEIILTEDGLAINIK